MSAPHFFELLQWHDAATSNPDADITMAVWSTEDGLLTAHWDDEQGAWIDCATGGTLTTVSHWANPKGPLIGPLLKLSDVPVEQAQGALHEACELLIGWVSAKCPKRHQAEHLAAIRTLRKTGGVS